VKEAAPAMTPEIYAVREGYSIQLAKALIGDPRLKYRKEVEAIAQENEGEISDINQSCLNELRKNLPLSSQEAEAIEAEVLRPYRELQEKLNRYEQVFRDAIQRRYPLSESDRRGLKRLQQALRLRDEDIKLIERRIPKPIRSPITRRQFLNIARFGGVGLGIAAVGRLLQEVGRLFPKPSSSRSPSVSPTQSNIEPSSQPATTQKVSLQSFRFDVVTVNAQGKERERQNKQAQFFVEDLGNGVTLEMVSIPAGEFLMGSPEKEEKRENDESPQHLVKVSSCFMGKFEVTQAQWAAVAKLPKVKIDLNPDPAYFKGAKRPVEQVSWLEVVEFCDRLSQKTGRLYRLPSEAEWEYACRAGTTTPFHFGATITTDLVNFNGNSTYASAPKGKYLKQTTEVGSFPPNAFGLYDLHGNVYEWCLDHWHENYNGAPTDGSAWLSNNEKERCLRLLRGGSWLDNPRYCRAANRSRNECDNRYDIIGFRVVFSVPRTP
jgi:formylglycine-generating enzyme required for sulfatase activity